MIGVEIERIHAITVNPLYIVWQFLVGHLSSIGPIWRVRH